MTPDVLKLSATALALGFPALAIVAALRDAATMTIPNWISAALVLAFFPAALVVGLPAAAIGIAAALGFGALLAGMAMFALNWIGGGDAKLFAASALWLGLPGLAPFLAFTAMAGGLLAVSLLGARKAAPALPFRGPAWLDRLLRDGGDVPYGVAIAAGALAAFPESPLAKGFHAFF